MRYFKDTTVNAMVFLRLLNVVCSTLYKPEMTLIYQVVTVINRPIKLLLFQDATTDRIRHERHRRITGQQRVASEADGELHAATANGFSGRRSHRERQQHASTTMEPERERRAVVYDDHHDIHRSMHHGSSVGGHQPGCSHRLVDKCTWPQCNIGCPNVRNPFTGNEMSVAELFRAARLDASIDFGTLSPSNFGDGKMDYGSSAVDQGDDMGERLMSLLMAPDQR